MDQLDFDHSVRPEVASAEGGGTLPTLLHGMPARFPAERFPQLTRDDLSVEVGQLSALTGTEVDAVTNSLIRFGCALIRPSVPAQRQELLTLCDHFGRVVRHKDSDETGVTTIAARGTRETSWGDSRLPQPPHTDGMYLKGGPPRLLALLSEKMPLVGGRSILTSGEALYNQLRQLGPEVVGALFRRDALQLAVDGQQIARPVLRRVVCDDRLGIAHEQVTLAFRSGHFSRSSAQREARPGINLIRSFIAAEENQVRFHIPEGSVFLVTNTGRVLHGREGWSKAFPRRLHRLWLDGTGDLTAHQYEIFGIPSSPERTDLRSRTLRA